MKALHIAATGMTAQQKNVDVISNNLANMNTTAFKRSRTEFQDLIYQDERRAGDTSNADGSVVPTGVSMGSGVKVAGTYRIGEIGVANPTGNSLDLAIQGRGYFQITLPSGDTAYTRDGSFQLNGNGDLVTHDGYVVQPGINIPQNSLGITVNASGEVLVAIPNNPQPQNLGQLQLASFVNDAGLHAEGGNLFTETAASGAPTVQNPATAGVGALLQGYLESSNVNAVTEITHLISAQRAYEMNSKTITIASDMMSKVSQLR